MRESLSSGLLCPCERAFPLMKLQQALKSIFLCHADQANIRLSQGCFSEKRNFRLYIFDDMPLFTRQILLSRSCTKVSGYFCCQCDYVSLGSEGLNFFPNSSQSTVCVFRCSLSEARKFAWLPSKRF